MRHPRLPRAPAALLSLLSLAACVSQPQPVAHLPVPDGLLVCQMQPDTPPDPVTDQELADWILTVADAGQDCRDKLAQVGGLLHARDADDAKSR